MSQKRKAKIEQSVVPEDVKQSEKSIEEKKFLYTGKSIVHFRFKALSYMLIPNATYTGLPDCPQVRELIEKNLLKEV